MNIMPTLREIYRARKIIYRYLKRTPLIYSKRLSDIMGFNTYLKLENLQPIKAFKVRGGIYYTHIKKEEAIEKGLITASTGNHGQSIAYSGKLIGAEVTIVMPHGISDVKVDALKSLGAKIVYHGKIFEEAREYAEKLAIEKNLLYVHPINEPLLYPGVATMHLENLEDLPEVDVVINPIGGGSGAIGAVSVYKRASDKIKVYGVQAEGARSFYLSWKRGRLVKTGRADTIAEGLATAEAYEMPLKILKDRLDDIILVDDNMMIWAIKLLMETTGQVVEPAGAASTAAAYKIRDRLRGKNVILMVTGGNIDRELLKKIIEMRDLE
jgi:threonine dehydratase